MAKTYNKMLIDVNEEIDGIITEVQADQNSRYLDIYLYNNGVPIDLTDHTVRIYMRRPKTDPLEEFFNDGEITEAENGRCQFLLTTQALAKEGYLEAQITIWKGAEELLSTHMFKIMVTKNLMSDGSVEASNEYGALVVLFQNLYEAYDLMVEMVQQIGKPGDIAKAKELLTMWQTWEYLVDYMSGEFTDMVEEALAVSSVKGILDLIGNTADIGGTTETGTVFAKLNSLFLVGVDMACAASNNVLFSPVTTETLIQSVYPHLVYCTYKAIQTSGTLRVTVSAKTNSEGFKSNVEIKVNDSKIATLTFDGMSYTTKTCDISFSAGDTISVEGYHDKYDGNTNLIAICGDLSAPTVPVPGFIEV